ncbi:MAG TPA: ferritin-like domain-containing protein [Ilumatobacteraceae bacterium]
MDTQEAANSQAAEQPDAGKALRRRILAAGLSGAALSLLPWLADSAGASPTAGSTDSTTPGSGSTASSSGATTTTIPATTTTAPPKRPTSADITLLQFLQTLELAARDLYNLAITNKVYDTDTAASIKTIGESHEAYEQAISAFIGRNAPNATNAALVTAMKSEFAGSPAKVSAAAAALENALVATHVDAVSKLLGIDGAALIASILVVEGRHAVVMNVLAGATKLDDELVSKADALTSSTYPK